MVIPHPLRFAALLCLLALGRPCLAASDEQLIGTWLAKSGFMTLKLELRADHTLYWSSLTRDDPNRRPVTAKWRVDQGHLFVRWELRDDWVKFSIFSVTRNTLVLSYPGRTTYRRSKP